MSEKLALAKLVIESDEKSKEIARKSRECCSRKKMEQAPGKKPMEETEKTAENKTEARKAEEIKSSPSIKTTSETSTSNKPDDPEAVEVRKMPETMSEITTSNKPKISEIPDSTSDEPQAPNVPIVCKILKIMSEISTFDKPETPKVPEVCEMPKTISEISTFDEPETPKVPKVCKKVKIMSEISISNKPDTPKVPEVCKMPKTISENSTTDEPETPKVPEVCKRSKIMSEIPTSNKPETPKVPEVCKMLKIMPEITLFNTVTSDKPETPKASEVCKMSETTSEISTSDKPETPKASEVCKMSETTSEISISDKPETPNAPEVCEMSKTMSEISTSDEPETPQVPEACQPPKIALLETFISDKPEIPKVSEECEMSETTSEISTSIKSEGNAESSQDIKNDNPEISTEKPEEDSINDTKSADNADNTEKILSEKTALLWNVAATRKVWPPLSKPDLDNDCLILATLHMLPSMPVKIFELFAEMIEAVTNQPVILMHESRRNRPAIKRMADIIIAPAAETWHDTILMPISFAFDHYLNKTKSAGVYTDVVVPNDRASHIKTIMDLRGHSCAIMDKRCNHLTADGLLCYYLQSKGENQSFFGNMLGANTQLEVLEMVASRQAEVGIVESPVNKCNRYIVPGANTLQVLASIGPLPPYRIMIDKKKAKLSDKIAKFLLNVNQNEQWMERLMPFGIVGFAVNSPDNYQVAGTKLVNTGVPYY